MRDCLRCPCRLWLTGRDAIARGNGGHSLSLSHPGVNVPGATVSLTLSGQQRYKGLLLLAEVDGALVASWGADLPEGVQQHPHCKTGLTHDTLHVGGKLRDVVPFVVPEGLAPGSEVVFKATVVRDYATWCAAPADLLPMLAWLLTRHRLLRFAFEQKFVVGSEEGAGAVPALDDTPVGEIGDAGATVAQAAGKDGDAGSGGGDAAPTVHIPTVRESEIAAFTLRRRRLRILHAAMMIFSWLIAAPAGAIAARSFKHLGAMWFDAHRMFQGAAVAATMFGAAIALGILHPTLRNMGPHGKLGTVVITLTCFQPLNAVFRPGKTAGKTRAAWKRLHSFGGWFTILCGAGNCVIGAMLMGLKEGDKVGSWYAALAIAAAVPLVGLAVARSVVRRTALPFTFGKSAKSTL